MSDFYILREGTPVPATVEECARWFQDQPEGRTLRRDQVGSVTVSTVFLGTDHSFGAGPPVLWETMVFNGVLDEKQQRYTSQEAALQGHADTLARVKELEGY
jgi:hypothetical protein